MAAVRRGSGTPAKVGARAGERLKHFSHLAISLGIFAPDGKSRLYLINLAEQMPALPERQAVCRTHFLETEKQPSHA